MHNAATYPVYIVISQTGTILSRILRWITKADYNHVSISLEHDLDTMYSFGRKNPYYPFWGGFVQESPSRGTFKRFYNTDVIVLAIPVDEATYGSLQAFLNAMYRNKRIYRYNYVGLVLSGLRIPYARRNHYYCSEFVRDVLAQFNVVPDRYLRTFPQPVHFLDIPSTEIIYSGKLRQFSPAD